MTRDLKISVITVSYNQGRFIEENIISVLNQQYRNFEHIIIDACSKDNTLDILRKYDHLIWTSEPDKGQSDGLNKGFRKATGDIIVWLNSDDVMCDGAFIALNKFFTENPDKYVVTGNQVFINTNSEATHTIKAESFTYNRLLNTRYCSVMQNSTVFRKAVLDKVGLLDKTLHYTMDLDLFIRIAKEYTSYTIDKDIAKFRVWEDSKTTTSQIKFYKNMLVLKKKHKAQLFSTGNVWLLWQFVKYPIKRLIKNG